MQIGSAQARLSGRIRAMCTTFLFPLALYGACRLGKPDSAWARRFYGERNPDKQGRSERRFPPDRRTERVKNWLRDLLGGSPEDEYLAKVAARSERDKGG